MLSQKNPFLHLSHYFSISYFPPLLKRQSKATVAFKEVHLVKGDSAKSRLLKAKISVLFHLKKDCKHRKTRSRPLWAVKSTEG